MLSWHRQTRPTPTSGDLRPKLQAWWLLRGVRVGRTVSWGGFARAMVMVCWSGPSLWAAPATGLPPAPLSPTTDTTAPPAARTGLEPDLPPSADPNDPPPLPNPIVTKQQIFTIPFTVNPRETPPSEVQLFVSADMGKSWQFYQRQAPQAGGFHFRAARDGDYCFAVRTLTTGTPNTQPADLPPELRVIVDTSLPELEFKVEVGRSGELRGHWSARDTQFAPTPIRVEYRTAEGTWTNVAIPPPAGTPSNRIEGEVSWWVDGAPVGEIEVRAVVEDRAGNSRQVVQRVTREGQGMTPAGEASSAPSTPASTSPLLPVHGGETNASLNSTRSSSTDSASPPNNPGTPKLGEAVSAQPWQATVTNDVPRDVSSGSGWTAVESAENSTGGPAPQVATADTNAASAPISSIGTSNSTDPQSGFAVHPPLANDYQPVPQRLPTPNSESATISSGTGISDLSPSKGSLPRNVRMSRSRTFELSYDLRHLTPGSVQRVDLWWTPDDGVSWSLYGTDDDLVSPMQVQVNREGNYGFRLVVQTRDGLSGAVPRPNEKPDVWVMTDWTRPVAEILGVDYGQGEQTGKLFIRYVATDAQLSDRPISLEYATEASGPWYSIASQEAYTGVFAWQVDASVPESILLRLNAEDRAGNRTTFPLRHPIALGPLRPHAQILDVRPVEDFPDPRVAPAPLQELNKK